MGLNVSLPRAKWILSYETIAYCLEVFFIQLTNTVLKFPHRKEFWPWVSSSWLIILFINHSSFCLKPLLLRKDLILFLCYIGRLFYIRFLEGKAGNFFSLQFSFFRYKTIAWSIKIAWNNICTSDSKEHS